jgi:glycine dehydrogenase subunit 2
VRNADIAKRLIDLGYHPPTVSFPLIVPNCFMVEPTETETPEVLDGFAAAMRQAAEDARESPDLAPRRPQTTPVARLDEGKAGRELVLRWTSSRQAEQEARDAT